MERRLTLCLGEALIDRVAKQTTDTVGAVTDWEDHIGGAPANVAAALVKLGSPATFIGAVGQDALGKRITQTLGEIGVNCWGVQYSGAPTRIVHVLRGAGGDRRFGGFPYDDPSLFADAQLQAQALPTELFAQADCLIIGTLGLAYPHTGQAIKQAIRLARHHHLCIAIDVNWRPMFWPQPDQAPQQIRPLLATAQWLKFAHEEAQWLFGTTDLPTLAQWHPRAKGIVITYGAEGCQYRVGGQQGYLPAFPVKSQDTTGAGDAFLAALLHQLQQHPWEQLKDPACLQQIMRFASAAGALTTLQAGAISAQPTTSAIEGFLDRANSA